MKWNKKFDYPASSRALVRGHRQYTIGDFKLPVTTILGQTQSEEKKKKLAEWRARQELTRRTDSAIWQRPGVPLCISIEAYLDGSWHLDMTSIGKEAGNMARKVIESGLGILKSWGLEVTVYPDLYAGATDVAESTPKGQYH